MNAAEQLVAVSGACDAMAGFMTDVICGEFPEHDPECVRRIASTELFFCAQDLALMFGGLAEMREPMPESRMADIIRDACAGDPRGERDR